MHLASWPSDTVNAIGSTGSGHSSQIDGGAHCIGRPLSLGPAATLGASTHPVRACGDALSCIRLIRAQVFAQLKTPVPRSQDLPDSGFGVPGANDLVIAVSHAWRNQVHPDPQGNKHRLLNKLLHPLHTKKNSHQSVLIFYDFLGVPQRPFKLGQEARSEEESWQFEKALACMHHMYFLADRIVHLELDEESIEGEGVEYIVSASDLKGALFEQVGDWVQVMGVADNNPCGSAKMFGGSLGTASRLPQSGSERTSRRKRTKLQAGSPFDRVLRFNGEAVSCVHKFHLQLKKDPTADVTLVRYPFGRVNRVLAQDRGWVFLERFITMVKCAMLDDENAMDVVLSNSDPIKEQIQNGARRLRDAALWDKVRQQQPQQDGVAPPAGCPSADGQKSGASALKALLNEFLGELSTKTFSAASTDKIIIDNSASDLLGHGDADVDLPLDSDIVSSIMCEFVQYLGESWQMEAAKQKRRAVKFRQLWRAAADYYLAWDRFSEEYSCALERASTPHLARVILLVILPPLVGLLELLPRFNPPDVGARHQNLYWFLIMPAMHIIATHLMPRWLTETTGIYVTGWINLYLLAWGAATSVLSGCLSYWATTRMNAFPLPFQQHAGAFLTTICIPVLWWAVPRHQRKDPEFRLRLKHSVLALTALIALFGFGFPLANAALNHAAHPYQALFVFVFLMTKIAFERLGLVMSEHLGADVMPCFWFLGQLCYEHNMCLTLASGFDWVVFVELVTVDLVENAYHLWSMFWLHKDAACSGVLCRDQHVEKTRKQFIVASLLIREFVELITPLIFMVQLAVVRHVRPRNNGLVCEVSDGDFTRMMMFLGLDLLVELGIFALTLAALRLHGLHPLRLLRGLISVHFPVFVAMAVTVNGYYFVLQHSHWGADLTFALKWVREEKAVWVCGTKWID